MTETVNKPARSARRHRNPPRWDGTPQEQREEIHANWGRFMEANPTHRLNAGGPAIICLVRHMAQQRRGPCRTPGCHGCARNARLRRLLDHGEEWECSINGEWVPAIAAHPYTGREQLIRELRETLDGLGTDRAGVRAYVSPATDGWYMPPQSVTFFLQAAGAQPIAGWTEVRAPSGAEGDDADSD